MKKKRNFQEDSEKTLPDLKKVKIVDKSSLLSGFIEPKNDGLIYISKNELRNTIQYKAEGKPIEETTDVGGIVCTRYQFNRFSDQTSGGEFYLYDLSKMNSEFRKNYDFSNIFVMQVDTWLKRHAYYVDKKKIFFSEGVEYFHLSLVGIKLSEVGRSHSYFVDFNCCLHWVVWINRLREVNEDMKKHQITCKKDYTILELQAKIQEKEEEIKKLRKENQKLKSNVVNEDQLIKFGDRVYDALLHPSTIDEISVFIKAFEESKIIFKDLCENIKKIHHCKTDVQVNLEILRLLYRIKERKYNFVPKLICYYFPFKGNVEAVKLLHILGMACDLSQHYTLRAKVEDHHDEFVDFFLSRFHEFHCLINNDNYNVYKKICSFLKQKKDQFLNRVVKFYELDDYEYGTYEGELYTDELLLNINYLFENFVKNYSVNLDSSKRSMNSILNYNLFPIDLKKYRFTYSQKGSVCFGLSRVNCKNFKETLPEMLETLLRIKKVNPHFYKLLLKCGSDWDFFNFTNTFKKCAVYLLKNPHLIDNNGIDIKDVKVIANIFSSFDMSHGIDSVFNKIKDNEYFKTILLQFHYYVTESNGHPKENYPFAKEWGFSDHMNYMLSLLLAYNEIRDELNSNFPEIPCVFTNWFRLGDVKNYHPEFPSQGNLDESFRSFTAEKHLLDLLFEEILPTLVNVVPLLLSGVEKNVMLGMARFLNVLHILNCIHYEKSVMDVMNMLEFIKKTDEKLFLFILMTILCYNSIIIEYIHSNIELLIKKNILKSIKEVNMLLKNLRAISSCRIFFEEFLGLKVKRTYHLKQKVSEKYIRIAKKVLREVYFRARGARKFRKEKLEQNFPLYVKSLSSYVEKTPKSRKISFDLHLKFLKKSELKEGSTWKWEKVKLYGNLIYEFNSKTFNQKYYQNVFNNFKKIKADNKEFVIKMFRKMKEVEPPKEELKFNNLPNLFVVDPRKIYGKTKGKTYDRNVRDAIVALLSPWILGSISILSKKDIIEKILPRVNLNRTQKEAINYVRNIKKDERKKRFKLI